MADSDRAAILVFVRAPELGRVKTRLAAELGDAAALAVYRRLAEHTVREVLAVVPREDVRIHYTPAGSEAAVRRWLGSGPSYLPQTAGDLGERLEAAFSDAFAAGYGRVVVVGSDLPGLSAALLERALEALHGADAVLGPARDGGYWLLGLRRKLPEVFRGIPWSTSETCQRTLERLRTAGAEPVLLPEMTDVDTAADLPPGWD